ncbi:MAG: ATP-binding cassette domain-containing protein [Lachnospiraceae bacterium]|nr:ATP-binding cassette domain-containing protein [Lachnospiraceae bacterium]
MARIELKGIKKTFEDGTEAVRGIDLVIEDGEFLVLLGPTGCGKTTLLRMIAGLDAATEGSVLFDGKDVTVLPPKKRNTAMVFQNYSLYPDRNIYKNIAFPLENLSLKDEEIDRRVRGAAQRLGITDILNEKPRSLSGGQKQRAALARALVREPSVFLLDEPFSNLDAEMRESLRDDLLEIHASLGTTFVYVTHDQQEAMETGSRIAVMHDGRLEEAGEPVQVWSNPRRLFTAGFVGRPKMNFFETSARIGSDGVHCRILGREVLFSKERFLALPEKGKSLTAGARAEAFSVCGPEEGIGASVTAVRPKGARIETECAAGSDRFTVLFAGRIPGEGETVYLKPKEEEIHLFDPETGERITKPFAVTQAPVFRRNTLVRTKEKTEERSSGIRRFGQVLLNEWWELLKLNLLFIVSCLGIITIPAAITAMNRICIMMEENEVHVLRRDYWNAFRRDFLRSLLGGAALAGMAALFGYAALLYAQFASTRSYLIFLGAVMIFLILLVWMTGLYFFPMNAKVDLPAGILLRNSFLLAVGSAKRTVPALLAGFVSYGLAGIGLWPHSILYIVAAMFSFTSLVNVFLVYPVIRQRVIKK